MSSADISEGNPCPQCDAPVEACSGRDCYCHISPPCESCIDDGLRCPSCGWRLGDGVPDDYVAPPEPPPMPYVPREIVRPAPMPAPVAQAAPPMYEQLSGSVVGQGWRAGVRRLSDGKTVWSTFWGVDDGSAQAEAWDLMRQLERK